MRCLFIWLIITITVFALVGCSRQRGNFSGLAIGTYRPENLVSSNLVENNARGESCKKTIFIFSEGQPHINDAVSSAVSKYGGDFMTNAKISESFVGIPFIYVESCWIVEGDVYRTNY